MTTYGQESEDMNNKHDILEHRHGSSAVDVAKVHDERNRPYLVLSVIDNLITMMKKLSVPSVCPANW
jgi:hypothetical protein